MTPRQPRPKTFREWLVGAARALEEASAAAAARQAALANPAPQAPAPPQPRSMPAIARRVPADVPTVATQPRRPLAAADLATAQGVLAGVVFAEILAKPLALREPER